MPVCEYCPGQGGEITCAQSKSLREMYNQSLMPVAELKKTVCQEGTDIARLDACPGFFDILDKGETSVYRASVSGVTVLNSG